MHLFETLLVMLFGAAVLSTFARRIGLPYPTLLALAGAAVAFLPGVPRFDLPPELILALFVAPVLLDAAFDTSLRDLRNNWRPVLSLVVGAVGVSTVVVALTARWLFPDLPLAAAVALGALLAPPDAVAALAVMRQVNPPHRLRKILEGESLLNDASALLIYKLAVSAVAAGSFSAPDALPTFGLVVVGSTVVGYLLAHAMGWMRVLSDDAPTAVVLQFVSTFGLWLLAERLGLSPVVTLVVFAVTVSQGVGAGRRAQAANMRVPVYAVWDAATFILNVLAFVLIGLQLGPILEGLEAGRLAQYLGASLVILGVVIAVRLLWVMVYRFMQPAAGDGAPRSGLGPLDTRSSLVIGWSGMRGIVTLAAALALPEGFPQRDFMLLAAFVVVLGTLVLQGLTLRPLLLRLRLPADDTVGREANLARGIALKAATRSLDDDPSEAAQRLRAEYLEGLSLARNGANPHDAPSTALRAQTVGVARQALDRLRRTGTIGDDAYHIVQEELDWLDLSAQARTAEG